MPVNMPHCRFRNTLEALKECEESLSNSDDPIADLEGDERRAAILLLKLCDRLSQDYDIGNLI